MSNETILNVTCPHCKKDVCTFQNARINTLWIGTCTNCNREYVGKIESISVVTKTYTLNKFSEKVTLKLNEKLCQE